MQIKEIFSESLNGILGSFSNSTTGWSGKKLSAFAIVLTYIYCHRFVNDTNLATVLGIDAGLITALFTVNVVDKFKNPMEQHDPNTPKEEKP